MHAKFRAIAMLRNIAVVSTLAAATPAWAHGYKVIHDFCAEDSCRDGERPIGLVRDPLGNLYGVTPQGGAQAGGTVFSLSPGTDGSWSYRVLHDFCSEPKCRDSFMPVAAPVVDIAGNLYGVTFGPNFGKDYGVIYRLSPNADRSVWTYSVLHHLNDFDGFQSESSLSYFGAASGQPYDGVSPLYGTTSLGGIGQQGVVFELAPKPGTARWRYRKIHEFCVNDCTGGGGPYGAVLVQAPGKLAGVTSWGGASNGGVVFALARRSGGWSETVLHSFCSEAACADGDGPVKGVIADAAGNLYGATQFGGRACADDRGCGVIYKVTPGGTQSVLRAFCAKPNCTDGRSPFFPLTMDDTGSLWGATDYGGGNDSDRFGVGGGTLFRFDGMLRLEHRFCRKAQCGDGAYPTSALLPDGAGGFFGTTSEGGAHALGTVFQLTP